jgi:hypothetical protein
LSYGQLRSETIQFPFRSADSFDQCVDKAALFQQSCAESGHLPQRHTARNPYKNEILNGSIAMGLLAVTPAYRYVTRAYKRLEKFIEQPRRFSRL